MQTEITDEAYIDVGHALEAQGVLSSASVHGMTICLLTTRAGLTFVGKSTRGKTDAFADAVRQVNHHYAYGVN